jgi:hypothetical protein
MSDGYNGWTNYETWCAKLWIDNDQGLYYTIQEVAKQYIKDKNHIYTLSNFVKDTLEEGMPEIDASLYSDLLNTSFSQINFYEIAESICDDLDIEDEDEEEKEDKEIEETE